MQSIKRNSSLAVAVVAALGVADLASAQSIIITNANLNTLINVTAAMVAGADATENQQLHHWQGRHISISAAPPQSIAVDGDLITAEKVTARILPGTVQVAVPHLAAPEGEKS